MIKKIDHIVITTKNIENCLEFYQAIGFSYVKSGARYEVFAGDFKINIHIEGSELLPHALNVKIGSADFCFETDLDVNLLKNQFLELGISTIEGPVARSGFKGAMQSIYLRDPDGNLVEMCCYD